MPKIKITKKVNEIINKDKRLFVTTTKESYPFVAERGEGDFAYDVAGNRFIDFSSFISVYNFGVNANEKVRTAIKNQVDKLMHSAFTDYYAELPVKFAEEFTSMFPKQYGKLFLSNSGTEANEAAIKFSKVITKRSSIMAFYNSFHGRTAGSLALTSSKLVQREHMGPFVNAVHVPYPYCYRCPLHQSYPDCGFACIDYIKDYPLSKEVSGNEVAAFVAEPIQGEGGYVVPPKGYFKELKSLTDSYGILFVSDEIQAGYFRAGKPAALDNFNVRADIYTFAKSVGAGLPMGVTMLRNGLPDIPAGAHATTFGGNLAVVAGAYALAKHVRSNMRSIEEQVHSKGRAMKARLEKMKERYEIIGDVRGMGMMLAIELVKDRKSKEPAIKERDEVIERCFYNGLLLLPAGSSTIRIIPPLTVSMRNIEQGLDILEDSLEQADRAMHGKPTGKKAKS
ncbi:MAG: aminotransferase class III-fold pyridoxal phosphate-dependent enzyme [Candidatus Marsarchaeota archaeon]|jgi:4-aminobutyrate aminotransferase|nr:aminotransferase class III-fold pyridoxal phosphate-dependent enzyme [Candidatus Marsarchaeota archaeon]